MRADSLKPAFAARLELSFKIGFDELYDHNGLRRVDAVFLENLGKADPALSRRLKAARENPGSIERKEESKLLMEVAVYLDDFLAQLFKIEDEVSTLTDSHGALAPMFRCKRQFVQRKAITTYKAPASEAFDGPGLEHQLVEFMGEPLSEQGFARHVQQWQQESEANASKLDTAMRYAAWAVHTAAGRARHAKGVLFKVPRKLDFQRLVPVETSDDGPTTTLRLSHLRRRDGFALTDSGTDLVGALDQANYCIWCHAQEKDSCSRGLKDKAGDFKNTVFGVQLAGCPLEERISEFQKLKADGIAIGALAMMCIDNPMVAATGHRICNDCMKSCIFQKQDPVDIPQVETRTLKDVLALPWGFEIYSLLTRWNPLHLQRPFPFESTGKRVLVAGMGPAGFSVAHHLINDGHIVVGMDGLKIEPLPSVLSGVDAFGDRAAFEPIRDFETLNEPLDSRVMSPLESSDREKSRKNEEGLPCPAPVVISMIGGKWKLLILQILIFQGTKRFGELERRINGITQAMLTKQLRALETDGLIIRKVYPVVPPKVEYSASKDGRALENMFKAMHAWWEQREVRTQPPPAEQL